MPNLVASALKYLHDTLGVATSKHAPWGGQGSLPYFLRDAFDVQQLEILGHQVLLALERHPDKASVADIRNRLDKLHAVAGMPVVYVTEALASYERRHLIVQKVPFIVPGNQLYLPDLGLDLREYFRQRPNAADTLLSPSAQAMLISALLRPHWEAEWHPAETAKMLGYTAMTVSRALRELVAAGFAEVQKTGRSQYLNMTSSAPETWKHALPLLRSPVQRTVWLATPPPTKSPMRVAGLSALARISMLAEPRSPVFAVNRSDWQVLKADMAELPESMPNAYACQLWNYSPALGPDSDMVDPLSLMLSLRDITDERVQSALDDLKEQLPW